MTRRAMFVLGASDLHRALGLPDPVRVVAVETQQNPISARVIIEGGAIPPVLLAGQDRTRLAWLEQLEAPVLWHPVQNFGVRFNGWTLGEGPDGHPEAAAMSATPDLPAVQVNVCTVDETVGAGMPDPAGAAEAAVLAAAWDAIAAAAAAGASAEKVRDVVDDALQHQERRVLRQRLSGIRDRVASVMDRHGASNASVDKLSQMVADAAARRHGDGEG